MKDKDYFKLYVYFYDCFCIHKDFIMWKDIVSIKSSLNDAIYVCSFSLGFSKYQQLPYPEYCAVLEIPWFMYLASRTSKLFYSLL
jgi:hypothetical protein